MTEPTTTTTTVEQSDACWTGNFRSGTHPVLSSRAIARSRCHSYRYGWAERICPCSIPSIIPLPLSSPTIAWCECYDLNDAIPTGRKAEEAHRIRAFEFMHLLYYCMWTIISAHAHVCGCFIVYCYKFFEAIFVAALSPTMREWDLNGQRFCWFHLMWAGWKVHKEDEWNGNK